MLFRINFTVFFIIAGSLLTYGFPASSVPLSNVPGNVKKVIEAPIGNPAEVFTNLFNSLSRVVIDKLAEIKSSGEKQLINESLIQIKRAEDNDELGSPFFEIESDDSIESSSDTSASDSDESSDDESLVAEKSIIDDAQQKLAQIKTEIADKCNKSELFDAMDKELYELEQEIKDGLNQSVFDEPKYQKIKNNFNKELKEMKASFVKGLENFHTSLTEYTQKINDELDVAKKASINPCSGNRCDYDLDESVSTDDMDLKLKELDVGIKDNLKLKLFEHHKFHRSQAHFINQFKKAKYAYLQKLNSISKKLGTFTTQAQSPKAGDLKVVHKMDDGYLYRNEHSLF